MNLSGNNKLILQQFFMCKPIKKAWIFGSYARNDEVKENDLDILLELDHTVPIGMKFFFYHLELEKLLDMKVDLVTSEGLSKYVKPFIDNDKILIYERANE